MDKVHEKKRKKLSYVNYDQNHDVKTLIKNEPML